MSCEFSYFSYGFAIRSSCKYTGFYFYIPKKKKLTKLKCSYVNTWWKTYILSHSLLNTTHQGLVLSILVG